MASQEFWDDQFLKGASAPVAWQFIARNLITTANMSRRIIVAQHERLIADARAANAIGLVASEGPDLAPAAPTIMLYGFAIENVTKAVLIAQGTVATKGLKIAQSLKTHDLSGLVAQTGLQLDDEERKFLADATKLTELGRYPVQSSPNRSEYAVGVMIPSDFERALKVLQRLESLLRLSTGMALPEMDLGAL
jgi:hypothetical protein